MIKYVSEARDEAGAGSCMKPIWVGNQVARENNCCSWPTHIDQVFLINTTCLDSLNMGDITKDCKFEWNMLISPSDSGVCHSFPIVFPWFSETIFQKSPSFLGANLAWGLDIAFTSYQKRAIKTLNLALEELDALWIPVTKSWKLNERMCLRRSGGWKMLEEGVDENVETIPPPYLLKF